MKRLHVWVNGEEQRAPSELPTYSEAFATVVLGWATEEELENLIAMANRRLAQLKKEARTGGNRTGYSKGQFLSA